MRQERRAAQGTETEGAGMRELLTAEELSRRLKVSPETVRKWGKQAHRRAAEAHYINLHSRWVTEAAGAHAAGIGIPGDLRGQVERRLRAAPETSWDRAIGQIVTEGGACLPPDQSRPGEDLRAMGSVATVRDSTWQSQASDTKDVE